ncbi:MAG TPA: hypothetical protein VMY35_12180 [Phycisphaerae bacterium]|nr:hypothetical protein [Phycisphaerae bacterium]
MANVTIDSELFYLLDTTPGVPDPRVSPPRDGFLGADHHNVAAAAYPVGTKVQVRNHSASAGVDGLSVFCYGKLEMQDTTNVLAARHFCAQHTDAIPFDFTNEAASDLGAGLSGLVVGLGAMTVDYFGWFWCAGVCPEEWVSGLGGVYYCSAAAGIGQNSFGDLETPGTTAGEIGLKTPAGDTSVICAILNTAAA